VGQGDESSVLGHRCTSSMASSTNSNHFDPARDNTNQPSVVPKVIRIPTEQKIQTMKHLYQKLITTERIVHDVRGQLHASNVMVDALWDIISAHGYPLPVVPEYSRKNHPWKQHDVGPWQVGMRTGTTTSSSTSKYVAYQDIFYIPSTCDKLRGWYMHSWWFWPLTTCISIMVLLRDPGQKHLLVYLIVLLWYHIPSSVLQCSDSLL
jgi:hypothetical protein